MLVNSSLPFFLKIRFTFFAFLIKPLIVGPFSSSVHQTSARQCPSRFTQRFVVHHVWSVRHLLYSYVPLTHKFWMKGSLKSRNAFLQKSTLHNVPNIYLQAFPDSKPEASITSWRPPASLDSIYQKLITLQDVPNVFKRFESLCKIVLPIFWRFQYVL